MKKNLQNVLLALILVATFGTMAFFTIRDENYTLIDEKYMPNTPMPTSTPSVFVITGLVSSEPTKHEGGSGMDTRVTVLTAEFAPIDLVGKDVIITLDATASQLKVGDKITLVYCEMDMSWPLQLRHCDFERIVLD